MDDSMAESVFDDGASSDFAPPVKTVSSIEPPELLSYSY